MKRRAPEPTPTPSTIPTAPCVIEPGDAFRCSCGAEQPAPGAYAAAHWNERLERRCNGCGSTIFLTSGRVVVVPKPERKRRTKGTSK